MKSSAYRVRAYVGSIAAYAPMAPARRIAVQMARHERRCMSLLYRRDINAAARRAIALSLAPAVEAVACQRTHTGSCNCQSDG